MLKNVSFCFALLLFLYSNCVIAQEYDRKIKVKITIKDVLSQTRPQKIIGQTHQISFDTNTRYEFQLRQRVGFEFDIDNQSASGKKFNYQVRFFDHRNSSGIYGGGTPIILPPEEDEDASQPTNTYPFTPQNISLGATQTLGIKNLRLTLSLQNALGSYNSVDFIDKTFSVTTAKLAPVSLTKQYDNTNFTIFSNLLTNEFQIEKPLTKNNSIDNIIMVELYSFQGILLKKSSLQPVQNNGILFYNFINPTLQRGLYIYKITMQGKTYIKKLQKK